MTGYPPPDWEDLYERHFPQNTDSTSRWVRQIADGFRDPKHPLHQAVLDYDDPERVAEALETTVIHLWEARAALKRKEPA